MGKSNPETGTETEMSLVGRENPIHDAISSVSLIAAEVKGKEVQNVTDRRPSVVDGISQPGSKHTPEPSTYEPIITSAPTSPAECCGDEKAHSPGESGGESVAKENSTQDAPISQTKDVQKLDGRVAYSWLKDLTSRVSSLEVNVNTSNDESSEAKAEKAAEIAEKPDAYMYRTISEVRDCGWAEFKNRFPDEKGIYAIEVLPDTKSLDEEIELEQLRRLTPEKKLEVLAALSKSRRPQSKEMGPRRLERVRINSAHVLAVLARVTGEKWAGKPHTFLRPFRALIHYQDKMEAEFLKLRNDLGASGDNVAAASTSESSAARLEKQDIANTPGPLRVDLVEEVCQDANMLMDGGKRKAYDDMTCYIELMRTHLIPIYMMFDTVDLSKPTKLRYHDLASLFRVGELTIMRSTSKSDNGSGREENRSTETQQPADTSQTNTAEPLVGKIFCVRIDEPDWEVCDLSDAGSGGHLRQDWDFDNTLTAEIGFYYIDLDGEEFKAVVKWFDIDEYVGERDVTTLPIFPLRFHKDNKRILENLQARGEKFQALVNQPTHKSLSYQGKSLDRSPLDAILTDATHIDSDIIIDFREAYSSHPGWKPQFNSYSKGNYIPRTADDKFDIIRWAGKERQEVVRRDTEVVIYNDAIQYLECDHYLDKLEGRFLMDQEDQTPEQLAIGGNLSKEDLVMLPSRLFAYALRERKFINANIRHVKQNPTPEPSSMFEQLKISKKHKVLIQSVVFEHFEKKKTQKQGLIKDLELSDQDFIRGKGRGLVILLHGAPGVGKTATAEAVSIAYNKPLFLITCGNLGIEPAAVENNLTELFRLANLWDCILLLDEAEIFLSPRAKSDDNLQRNAIVSVFLRTLEYYSGVLFLTTNRSGALDEAVKSRVHLSLLYPHLGFSETISLFRMNIERLKQIESETEKITGQGAMTIEENSIMDFAKRHFEKFRHMEDSRWNGRQIRNAFQIAASLARYQSHHPPHRGLYVGAEHFQEVEDATLEYDDFRNRTAGKTDGELAHSRGDRGPDRPQPFSAAPEWRPNPGNNFTSYHSNSLDSRYGAARSPQRDRTWAYDSHTEYNGSPAWSSGNGHSTAMPNQPPGSQLNPHRSVGSEGGGGYAGRDQQYRPFAEAGPSTPVSYQTQSQRHAFSPRAFTAAGSSGEHGSNQQYSGIDEEGGAGTPMRGQVHRPARSPHGFARAVDAADPEGWNRRYGVQEAAGSSRPPIDEAQRRSFGASESNTADGRGGSGWDSQYGSQEAPGYPQGNTDHN